VYSPDRSEALISFAKLTTAMSLVPAPLLLPGLVADRRYRVERVPLPAGGAERGPARTSPAWLTTGAEMSGRELAVLGLQLPVMNPESALLIHLSAC
jgi:alpha-galactosidase